MLMPMKDVVSLQPWTRTFGPRLTRYGHNVNVSIPQISRK